MLLDVGVRACTWQQSEQFLICRKVDLGVERVWMWLIEVVRMEGSYRSDRGVIDANFKSECELR